ncbi:MAG: 1,2-phenylacetyl-CoA epoxidase subunit PaaC [Bacteroidota bacterium]|nr:1,2-phenylacetyl-CoA epoxidase subunit PaaC [Bacteroidota bacterium]
MLSAYLIQLADNALILGHRNSEWTGHGPVLEQDIALSNIALDLIGQSRNLYQLAASRMNTLSAEKEPVTEDDLAYLREAPDFKNVVLLEQPNGDWAKTILRQFYFSRFQLLQFRDLLNSKDADLAAIAEKSIKEIRYHVKWSSEWVCRLGDGTTESHTRMLNALEELNPLVAELFTTTDYELAAATGGWGTDPACLQPDWLQAVNATLQTATLPLYRDEKKPALLLSGKNGFHSEHLGFILAEMQFLQRAYPGCDW